MALGKGLNRGLGKGFDSLLPQNFDTSLLLTDDDRIQKISLDQIVPNPDQPRSEFDQEALQQLASSLKQFGVLQPIVVTPAAENGQFIIIAGERRWRAAAIAKLAKVPAIVRTTDELERLEIVLVENVQRVDLSPLEQAISIERLHQQFNTSYDIIGKRLGKSPSTVSNIVRLLQLPEAARQALKDKQITEGHGRAILALKDKPEVQQDLLEQILKEGWSVRQAERYVTSHKAGVAAPESVKARVDTETRETKVLSERLGSAVSIRRTAKGGRLELKFISDDDLERLIKLLESISN